MGRSVSYASSAQAVCYSDVSRFGYQPDFDENGNEVSSEEEDWIYDEFCAQEDWDYWIDDIKHRAMQAFPSLTECDEWLDRDDRAMLENSHCYIGVSEYCGLASIWLVCKTHHEDVEHAGLAEAWCAKAEAKFNTEFGELRRIATASNGESLYERVKA